MFNFPEHCGHGLSYRLTDDPSLVHLDRWNRYSRDFPESFKADKKGSSRDAAVIYSLILWEGQ